VAGRDAAVEHTLLLVELPPASPGSATVLREEIDFEGHPTVSSVTLHVRLRRPLPESSDAALQIRVGPADVLEAPTARPVVEGGQAQTAAVPEQHWTTVHYIRGATSLTGTAVLAAGHNRGIVRGMHVSIGSAIEVDVADSPDRVRLLDDVVAKGYVSDVGELLCEVRYALTRADAQVRNGADALIRRSHGGDPAAEG
jgi:hypothetical protein